MELEHKAVTKQAVVVSTENSIFLDKAVAESET